MSINLVRTGIPQCNHFPALSLCFLEEAWLWHHLCPIMLRGGGSKCFLRPFRPAHEFNTTSESIPVTSQCSWHSTAIVPPDWALAILCVLFSLGLLIDHSVCLSLSLAHARRLSLSVSMPVSLSFCLSKSVSLPLWLEESQRFLVSFNL